MRGSALIAIAFLTSPALAEETICTPDHYYNWNEPSPLIIDIDAARGAGSMVTRIDIETGAYREHHIGAEASILDSGTMMILNEGSLHDRIDFVAIDRKTNMLLHISLIDQNMPFVRVDSEGTVASGHCVYEYDLVPK